MRSEMISGTEEWRGGPKAGLERVKGTFCRAGCSGPLNFLLSMRKTLTPSSESPEPKPCGGHSALRLGTEWTKERLAGREGRKPPRKIEFSRLPFYGAPQSLPCVSGQSFLMEESHSRPHSSPGKTHLADCTLGKKSQACLAGP